MSTLLAECCKIEKVARHQNADKLDLATVKGWQCVVARDSFKPGDTCIFVPPDSVVPPDFIKRFGLTYLKNNCGRVGVVKLRGEYSYGLVLPNVDGLRVGENVAARYGITKWEPPVKNDGMGHVAGASRKKSHQALVRYTDVENIKNFPGVIQPDELVYETEKVHGMNVRYGWLPAEHVGYWRRKWLSLKYLLGRLDQYDGQDFIVGSHNIELSNDATMSPWRKMAVKLHLDRKGRIPPNTIFIGEIYGPGIQPGFDYCLSEPDVVFFDVMVYTGGAGRYLDYEQAKRMVLAASLSWVPELPEQPGPRPFSSIDVEMCAVGRSKLAFQNYGPNTGYFDAEKHIREGVVLHLAKERVAPNCGRVIMKVINPEYSVRKSKADEKGTWQENADV